MKLQCFLHTFLYRIHWYPETRTYGSSTSFDTGFVCDDDTIGGEMAMVK